MDAAAPAGDPAPSRLDDDAIESFVVSLPKSELHLHLDGSLSPNFIVAAAQRHRIPIVDTGGPLEEALQADAERFGGDPHELRRLLHEMKAQQVSANDNRVSTGGNWSVFDFCNRFLQTRQDLREATCGLLRDLSREHNVRLCEIRFCPVLHTLEGLTPEDAVEAVLDGYQDVYSHDEETDVVGGVIICALRSYPEQHGLDMAELAARYLVGGEKWRERGVGDRSEPAEAERRGTACARLRWRVPPGVVGFDVAGDEGSFPIGRLATGIRRASELGVPVTLHAGEWPANGKFGRGPFDNCEQICFGPELTTAEGAAEGSQEGAGGSGGRVPMAARIGHGCQLASELDPERRLMQQVRRHGVTVECCLTSNVGWKVRSYGEHPIRDMIRNGVRATLNCDNLLLSGSADRAAATPSGEVRRFLTDVAPGMLASDVQLCDFGAARADASAAKAGPLPAGDAIEMAGELACNAAEASFLCKLVLHGACFAERDREAVRSWKLEYSSAVRQAVEQAKQRLAA